MNEYNIFGAIVDSDSDKWSSEDITLSDFCSYLKELKDGDEVSFIFNSPGGSVTAGLAMANKIRALKDRGIKTTARVEGVCASIATVMMCACDDIVVSKGSFVMIHNCWGIVQGDVNTLRKEADLMEKMNEAILSFYRSKFNATDEKLKQWMDSETWISSDDVDDFGLICRVEDFGTSHQIAASIKRYDFKHIPRGLKMKLEEELKNEDPEKVGSEELPSKEEETKKVETSQNEDETKKEPSSDEDETKVEDPEKVGSEELPSKEEEPMKEDPSKKEEPVKEDDPEKKETPEDMEDPDEDDPEQLKTRIAELEQENEELRNRLEQLSKDGEEKANARVSGMQSKMQSKINDFANQLKAREGELTKMKNEVTSLLSRIDESNNELKAVRADLDKTSSALQDKTDALDALNSRVLGKAEEVVDWRNLKGQEFWDFLDKHPEIIKQH